jgi:small subunit ribosomal protein S14
MARKALKVKAQRKPKYRTRLVRRCGACGRKHGFLEEFNMCRICFRERAIKGEIPGYRKTSW